MMIACSVCRETTVCFSVAGKFYCESCNEKLSNLRTQQGLTGPIKVLIEDIEGNGEGENIALWAGELSILPRHKDVIFIGTTNEYYVVDDYTWWFNDNPVSCTMYVTPEE